ncbi:MAG TPA: hypothetical protein VMA75_00555 [Candidatus Paceibacterota bacterium]|nr:hypothetical protein [Candidatus Paceibacterota bacterium]
MRMQPYAVSFSHDQIVGSTTDRLFCINGVHVKLTDEPTADRHGKLFFEGQRWVVGERCDGSCKQEPVEIPPSVLRKVRRVTKQAE